MPTNAEIKALIDTRVRAQRSHILHDGVAEILDFMVDNIAAGGGGSQGIDSVLAEGNDAGGIEILNAADPTTPQSLVTVQYFEDNLPAEQTIDAVLQNGSAITEDRGIELDGFTFSFSNGKLRVDTLEFADNAAALSGGLTTGTLYRRTGHGLDIVT